MNIVLITGILTFILSLSFGSFILLRDVKNRTNQLFFLFALFVSFWGIGSWKISTIPFGQIENALLWWRLAHFGVIFIPVFFLHFIYLWLDIKERAMIYFAYIFSIFYFSVNLFDLYFFPAVSSGLFINNIKWLFDSVYWNVHDFDLYWPFFGLWIYFILFANYKLLRVYIKVSNNIKRSQIKIFLISFAIAYAGGVTAFLPCFGLNYYPYLSVTVPLYIPLLAYAIIIYRFMDIKVVLRKYSVYLLSLLVIIIPTTLLQYFYPKQLDKFSSFSHIFLIIIAVSVFPFIKYRFYKLANKYFFSSLYDSRQVISKISELLRSTIDVVKMYQSISQILMSSFHVKAIGVLIYNEKKGEYLVQYNDSNGDNKFLSLPTNKNYQYGGVKISTALQENYLSKNLTIVVDELKNKEADKYRFDIEYFESIGVELLVPLAVKDHNIGLIVLSAKESGDMYNDEDLYVLKVISTQVAISLENALLYQETLNFNIKLKKEVAKQTKELVEANEKLTKLDQAKSEFISIASHQLRTPLTVVKGYISMILDGNFGSLTPGEKKALDKVYESNERLIRLVESLLNVSRIESGRLQFNFESRQLEDLITSVYEELMTNAARKSLKFEFIKPTTKLPPVSMDEEKLRQVVMNLVDNSIKYTPKGNVTITLKKQKDNILFCVADSGLGILAEDLPNLFKKFSRGTGISLVHTEGTGLGLFVARQMIEAHGGRTWAESAGEGLGSKFCFEIPYIKIAKK